ncbi:hypothetical protein ABZ574_23160 [Streptomyces anulatus]
MRAALDLSYQGLPRSAARLYRLLGLHPGREFGVPVAWTLLGEDAVEALDALHDANLLVDVAEASGGERHRFHDLVRLHAAALAAQDESGDERAVALLRIGHHYLADADRAEEVIEPGRASLEREFGRGVAFFQERGDALGHARTLNYRGLAHQRLGQQDRAAEYFARAAAELPALGDLRPVRWPGSTWPTSPWPRDGTKSPPSKPKPPA